MKQDRNIHVLPTDKPSRLQKFINYAVDKIEFELCSKAEFFNKGQNIYITNDEEIKEGDWYFVIGGIGKKTGVYKSDGNTPKNDWCKKIILTTDVDLIKDGVQPIPDEFLEWFVKNPSCESVEVENDNYVDIEKDKYVDFYKIIFPKEEPNIIDQWLEKNGNPEIAKQVELEAEELYGKTLEELAERLKGKELFKDSNDRARETLSEIKSLPIQETLEEVAERIYLSYENNELLYGHSKDLQLAYKAGIFDGAKWQQEQDKKLYSEEEVLNILMDFYMHKKNIMNPHMVYEWFEQFKKK